MLYTLIKQQDIPLFNEEIVGEWYKTQFLQYAQANPVKEGQFVRNGYGSNFNLIIAYKMNQLYVKPNYEKRFFHLSY